MNTFKKSILAASCASILIAGAVTADPFKVGFTTVKSVSLDETQSMAFGAVLQLADTSTCQLVVSPTQTATANEDGSGVAQVGEALYFTGCAGIAAEDAAAATAGDTVGTPAIIEIDAAAGSAVDITVVGGDDPTGDVSLVVSGYVSDFAGAGLIDPTRVAIADNVLLNANLPDNGATDADTDPGKTMLVLGGTITNNADLPAETDYVLEYTVTVTY